MERSLKSMAAKSDWLSANRSMQLGLIDVKRDGEFVRIVADDMIDLQKGATRRVIG
jgi:hypothetical protein